MATPSIPDPKSSWSAIARHAAAEPAPTLDVRAAVLRQIEAERLSLGAPEEEEDFAGALFSLLRMKWMRLTMGAICAATLFIACLGWQAAEALSDPILYAATKPQSPKP